MAWNEPGGNNNQQDPWNQGGRGQRGNGQGGGNDGPPDLDEALKQFQNKIRDIFGGDGGGNSGSQGSMGMAGAIFGIVALLYLITGAYQLDEKEKAVILRLGAFKEVVGPGFHWNPPIIDQVYKENVTELRTHPSRGEMLTEDENIVEVYLSVQYNIADIKKFKLSIRDPELALQEATESALRHVVGSSIMDEVLTTGREVIASDVQLRLEQYLSDYDTGINISTVNVEKTQAPSQVQAAFDDVIKAREDEQRVQNEAQSYANQVIPEARGKAKRMEEEARAYHDQVVARAEGESDRFKKLLREYKKAPRVTRERLYLDSVQEVMQNASKIMVDVEGGNNMMYLPLDKILKELPASSTSGSSIDEQELENLKRQIESLRRGFDQNMRSSRGGIR